MGEGYLETISQELGIHVGILIIILLWTIVWKLIAMWKAAKKKSIVWFIALALLNTIGILPILYIYVFSEIKTSFKKSKKKK